MSLRTSIQRQRMTKIGGGGVLPSGYTECEYLKSDGSQYITTDILIEPLDEFYLKLTTENRNGTYYGDVFGGYAYTQSAYTFQSGYATSGTQYGILITKGTTQFYSKKFGTSLSYTDEFFISPTDGIFRNGEKTADGYGTNVNVVRTYLAVFAQGNDDIGGVYRHSGGATIHAFAVKRDGADILNLIPALDTNGRPCMYDTISKTPFYNEGTGEFEFQVK